jgi:hypothetical protein
MDSLINLLTMLGKMTDDRSRQVLESFKAVGMSDTAYGQLQATMRRFCESVDLLRVCIVQGVGKVLNEPDVRSLARCLEESDAHWSAIINGHPRVVSARDSMNQFVLLCWDLDLQNLHSRMGTNRVEDCKMLRKWIASRGEERKTDLYIRIKNWLSDRFRLTAHDRRWSLIGKEVIERKTLWLTAANELRKRKIPNQDRPVQSICYRCFR